MLRSTAFSPSGGFSWVLIDAEHGLITDHHYYEVRTSGRSQALETEAAIANQTLSFTACQRCGFRRRESHHPHTMG